MEEEPKADGRESELYVLVPEEILDAPAGLRLEHGRGGLISVARVEVERRDGWARIGPFWREPDATPDMPVPDMATRRRMAQALLVTSASGWQQISEVYEHPEWLDEKGDRYPVPEGLVERSLERVNLLLDIARGVL